jgi:hypothetical protein
MKTVKKTLWLLFCSGLAALLMLIALTVFGSHLLNLESVKERIVARLSATLGGQLTYHRTEIVFFPRPHAIIHGTRLSVPGRLEGSLHKITAYPQILPLSHGRIRFSRIDLEAPRFHLNSLSPAAGEGNASNPSTEATIRAMVAATAMHPLLETPGLRVRIISGRFDIGPPEHPSYHFEGIHARLRRTIERIHLKLACRSKLWEQLVVVGQLAPATLQGYATAQIKGFQPHRLPAAGLIDSKIRLTESQLDLNVNVDVRASEDLRIDLKGIQPEFHLMRGGENVTISGQRVEAVLRRDAGHWSVGLSVLELDRPRLRLSGNALVNRLVPEFNLELSAVGVDVDPLRRTALTLAGDNPSVRDVFDVIRGGRVPVVTVSAAGGGFRDLNKLESYLIKGRMADGRIYIPGAELDLTEVRGRATIVDGLLRGNQLHARLDESTGSDGSLLLGLLGATAPFHLDIQTHADVARLQPVLMRLVGGKKFQDELNRIRKVSGRAVGRLILGERLDEIQATAVVSSAELRAEYGRIPYPIRIRGGRYILNQSELAVENIQARIGDSLFSDLSMKFGWEADAELHVAASDSHVLLAEINTWLATLHHFRPFQNHFAVREGIAHIDDFELRGPLRDMANWRCTVAGRLEQFEIETPHVSKSLAVSESRFDLRVDGNRRSDILLSATRMHWHDSNLDIGGWVHLSQRGIEVDLQLNLDRLSWQRVREVIAARDSVRRDGGPDALQSFGGTLNVKVERMKIDRWTLTPVQASIYVKTGELFVDVTEAAICGISVPGVLNVSPPELTFHFQPRSSHSPTAPTLVCFGGNDDVITGTFDLTGQLHVDVIEKSLLESLQGEVGVEMHSGRIHRYGVLGKILAVLNVTEIFKGKLPDLVGKGFAYETVKIRGHLDRGTFILDEAVIDGASMTVGYKGRIDLVHRTLDLAVLVAPFKTIDSIIAHIPLIRELFGGQLISIPFLVQGTWQDFEVQPMAVSQADTGLLGMLNKVLKAPTLLFQPMPADAIPPLDISGDPAGIR